MDTLFTRVAGLDVHLKEIQCAVRCRQSSGKLLATTESFGTMTRDLRALADYLRSLGVTHVAMESTAVLWKPVWNILEGLFTLLLVNPRHLKKVPGRKTDVSDAAWLAELLAHGLIRASFVPDGQTQELRALLRTRKQLVRERTRHTQRIHKTLEDANIKIDGALSDILGKSGRAMLEAMIAGESDPVRLAALAHRNVKASQGELEQALRGRVTAHHRFLLKLHLGQVDHLDGAIATVDGEVEASLAPFRTAVELVSTIPGVSALSAEVIISEIGLDMGRFPTVGHLISWAGLSPRNDQSAGKRRSTRMRKGAQWLKTTLVQCAWAAKNKKSSYLQAQFRRLLSRRGPQKAICAVAASILTAAYHMLKDGTCYQDLGPEHFNRRSKTTHSQRLVRQLQRLGYAVEIKPIAA